MVQASVQNRKAFMPIGIHSLQLNWQNYGSISAVQAALAATARAWADVDALAANKKVLYKHTSDINIGEFRFETDTDGDVHVVDVYVSAGQDHFTRMVTLTITGGTQTSDNGVFCRTIAKSNEKWPTAVEVVTFADGADDMGRVIVDLFGWDYVLFIATTLQSGKTLRVQGKGC